MALLLVDDRDGKVVAEVDKPEDAQRVVEAWARDDGSIPDYFCLVELASHHSTVFGTDTSVKIRPLPSP